MIVQMKESEGHTNSEFIFCHLKDVHDFIIQYAEKVTEYPQKS